MTRAARPGKRGRLSFLDVVRLVLNSDQPNAAWSLEISRPDSDEGIDVSLNRAVASPAFKDGELNIGALLSSMQLEPGEWNVELVTEDEAARKEIEDLAGGRRVPWSGRFHVVQMGKSLRPGGGPPKTEDAELAAKERQIRANELRIAELRQEKQLKDLERQIQPDRAEHSTAGVVAELGAVLQRLVERQPQGPPPPTGLGLIDLALKAQPLIERLIDRFIEAGNERNQVLAAAIASGRQAAPAAPPPPAPVVKHEDQEAYLARQMATTEKLIGMAKMLAEGQLGGPPEGESGDAIGRLMGVLNKVQEILGPLMTANGIGPKPAQPRLPAAQPEQPLQEVFPGAVGPHLHGDNGKKVADMQANEGRQRILQWVLAVERELNIGSDPEAVANDATIQKGYQVTPRKFREFLETSEPVAVIAGMEQWIPRDVASRLRAACEQDAAKTDWLLAFLDALLGEPDDGDDAEPQPADGGDAGDQ